MSNFTLGDYMSPKARRLLSETNNSSPRIKRQLLQRDELISQKNFFKTKWEAEKSENNALKMQLSQFKNQRLQSQVKCPSYSRVLGRKHFPTLTPLRRNMPSNSQTSQISCPTLPPHQTSYHYQSYRPFCAPFERTHQNNFLPQPLNVQYKNNVTPISSFDQYDSSVPSLRYIPVHLRSSFSFTPSRTSLRASVPNTVSRQCNLSSSNQFSPSSCVAPSQTVVHVSPQTRSWPHPSSSIPPNPSSQRTALSRTLGHSASSR